MFIKKFLINEENNNYLLMDNASNFIDAANI